MDKRWVGIETPAQSDIQQLAKSINVNTLLAQLLVQRGIKDFDDARSFFRPDLSFLHDPFLMQDMSIAVNRLSQAVAKGQKVLVYGDYDVDGTTSVAMAYSFLKTYLSDIAYYIPDRYTEGYGISQQGVEWAVEEGYQLMIALDCGITGHAPIAYAAAHGLDVIVCDHHQPEKTLPEAFAVLDPKRADCPYPFKELSGCGVGFKLLEGFCEQQSIGKEELYKYLDLLVVSIASDIVPMEDENRVLAYFGLKKLNDDPLPGLLALKEISGIRRPARVSDIVFYLGPRINAAGRLSHARESVAMLLANSADDLHDFSHMLNDHNVDRKSFDQSITEEALQMIEEDFPASDATVLWKSDWHKGVIGIVASRCIEHYYRPTIVLTGSGDEITGSARSVEGYDIHRAIGACQDYLIQFGGHKYAAGLKMQKHQLDNFRTAFNNEVARTLTEDQRQPRLQVDLTVPLSFISFKVLDIIAQMAPFGPGNPAPLFRSDNVYIRRPVKRIKEIHGKFVAYQSGCEQGFEAIAFGMAELLDQIKPDVAFQMVYHLEENQYQGHKTIQLVVKDVKFAI